MKNQPKGIEIVIEFLLKRLNKYKHIYIPIDICVYTSFTYQLQCKREMADVIPAEAVVVGPAVPTTYEQFVMLFRKNYLLNKRSPVMMAAEYFIMPFYCIFWLRIVLWIFPDDRPTLPELKEMEDELNKALPNACTFIAQTAFVPSTSAIAQSLMTKLAVACGSTFSMVKGFKTVDDFETAYNKDPANYYACLKFDDSSPSEFTVLYNETLTEGRFLPNLDEATYEFKSPPLTYVPALTTRGRVMAMGDNRLADFTSRVQLVVGNVSGVYDSINLRAFPFEKPTCDGAGCVMKFMWPQMIISAFFITAQSFLVRVGGEKEKGIKEALYLSGTSQLAYWGSWFALKIIDLVVPVVFFTTLLYASFVWTHQYYFVVLAITFLYAVSFIVHVAFVQAFCKTGMQMFFCGVMMLFVFSAIYYPIRLLGIDKGWDESAVTPFFLFPPIAIGHIFWEFQEADSIGIPLSFENNGILVNAVWMMAVDIFFWGILGLYFEQIMPQAHGPAFESNPLFFLSSAWWGRKKSLDMKVLEGVKGVEIKNLVKEFDSKDDKGKKIKLRAVDDLSVSFKSGQVTAVLGHNGAGKTTTIRCMTASHSVTSGTIMIDGIDASENAAWVRKNVGVCPQHDVLYDGLTAKEHIELFGALKGDRNVDAALRGVDLLEKADELVGTFSGGQKRRLSVAISLLGDPKLIVLDEPTTGMDVIARQSVWNMVESRKKGRCIILTTHSMEEADALGDEVVVLGKGKVQAQGTSLELKNKFGIGFHLHIVKNADKLKDGLFKSDDIMDLLKKHLEGEEGLKMLTDVGAECSFAIPREKAAKFPGLFTALAAEKESLGVEQFAISQTTLEEVFLELEKKEREEEEAKKEKEAEEKKKKDGKGKAPDAEEEKDLESGDAGSKVPVDLKALSTGDRRKGTFCQQTYGMMYLIICTYLRNPTAICFLIIQPIMLVCITGAIYAGRDLNLPVTELIVPLESPPATFPYCMTSAAEASHGMNYVNNITAMTSAKAVAFDDVASLEAHLIAEDKSEYGSGYQFALFIDKTVNSTALDVRVYINATWSDPPFNHLKDIAALVTNAGADFGGNAVPVPTMKELAKGPTAKINAAAWGAGGIMIIISMVFAYLSALFAENMARGRVQGHRVHLFVSSMGRVQYYMGHFVADTLSILVPLLLTPAIMAAFGFKAVLESNVGAFLLLGLLSAPSLVAFGYVMNWLFQSVEAAQEWGAEVIGIFSIMPFFITGFVVDASELAHTLLGLVPGYAFFRGLSVLEADAAAGKPYLTGADMFDTNNSLVYVYIILVVDAVFYWILVVAIEKAEAPVRRLIAKLRQQNLTVATTGAGSANQSVQTDEKKPDARVEEEKESIVRLEHGGSLIIDGIEQKFVMQSGRINHAVKGIFLGIPKGEVFGLLGMNGAGKTTLLHTIQGKHVPAAGDCSIEKISAVTDSDRARELFGICPQHDVLWEEVSPRQHLVAFANIRGVPKENVDTVVTALLKRLDINHKANAPSKTLSGGQKRKVSIAMAVIGNPTCVFLDEPTTGLDPNTRRFVWDYIMELKEGRVVVLTTHSMEEADALCGRIGIMVNGRLMTLGTPQQLKKAYGTGYKFVLSMKGNVDNANETIGKVLEKKYTEDLQFDDLASSETHRVFSIKRSDLDFGELFQLLEDHREAVGLEDYSVTQASMDEVFKNFARFQMSE